ncbi:MAG: Crp/Fnr family transcriptional regulator [Spirochaetia bacterium]|nr:Crp/Fnr family transcriptional regulator [Spirochaetia bacterium]
MIGFLRSQGKILTVCKEAVVHTQMEKCTSVGFLLKGTLRMTKILSTGKEFVLRNLTSGEMYGELICFAENTYPCWIVATEKSIIFEIPTESMFTLLQKNPFLRAFMKSLSEKSLHLTNTIELLSLKKVNQKLAYCLLLYSEREGLSSFKLEVSVTDLAAQLGSSREAVSRALSELENLGYIKREGAKVIILHHAELENMLI